MAGQAQAPPESLSLGSGSSVAKSEEFPSHGHLMSSFLMDVHEIPPSLIPQVCLNCRKLGFLLLPVLGAAVLDNVIMELC